MKTRIALATVSLTLFVSPAASEDEIHLDRIEIEKCFGETLPIARLRCYDTLFKAPAVSLLPQGTTSPTNREPEQTPYLRFLRSLNDTSPSEISLFFVDPSTRAVLRSAVAGGEAFRDMVSTSPENLDVYISINGRVDAAPGTRSQLVLACEEEITRMLMLWDSPFKDQRSFGRIYTDRRPDNPYRMKLFVVQNGYAVRPPLGLETIRMLRQLRKEKRLNFVAESGSVDRQLRSAHFDIRSLDQALRPLSRRCDWKR